MGFIFFSSIFIKLFSVLFIITLNVVIDQERHAYRRSYPTLSKTQPYGWLRKPFAKYSILLISIIILALIFGQDGISVKTANEKETNFTRDIVGAVTTSMSQMNLPNQILQEQIKMNLEEISQKIQAEQTSQEPKNEKQ